MANELQPILRYLVIIGLAPYSRQRQQHQQIYTLVFLTLNILTTIHGLYSRPNDEFVVADLISVLLIVSTRTTIAVIQLEVIWTFQQHFQFLEQSKRIKDFFRRELNTQLCWQHFRRQQLRKLILYMIVAYGSLFIYITMVLVNYYNGNFWYSFPAIVIIRVRCLQSIIFTDYIGYYLEMLNVKLTAVVSCKAHQQHQVLDVDYSLLESLPHLLKLKQLYKAIGEFTQLFNDLFGWSLLVLVLVIVLDIIVHTYWSFLVLADLYPFYYLYLTIFIIFSLTAIISLMSFSAENCQRQCQQTGNLVKRLLCSSSSFRLHTSRLYHDIAHEFLIEVMQHPIEIHAKDFFVLDSKLLMQIVAAMVTYLVILLQFCRT